MTKNLLGNTSCDKYSVEISTRTYYGQDNTHYWFLNFFLKLLFITSYNFVIYIIWNIFIKIIYGLLIKILLGLGERSRAEIRNGVGYCEVFRDVNLFLKFN